MKTASMASIPPVDNTRNHHSFRGVGGWSSVRLLTLLATLVPVMAWAFTPQDISLLESEIALRDYYQQQKQQRIDSLLHAPISTYDQLLALTTEYQSYSYDTATIYVEKLLDEATHLNDPERLVQASLKHAFIFLSSGLFKESADVLEDMDVTQCSQDLQAEYYITYARLLYDMADYTHGQLASLYRTQGYSMSEQALLRIDPVDTARYWSTAALYAMKQNQELLAIERFQRTLSATNITEHEKAIAYSSMGGVYQGLKDTTRAEHYWLMAAVSDIRSCTKEAVAMGFVAQLLFEQGDIDHAARYIEYALDDAKFYNARHRQLSIGKIVPIIEQQQLITTKAQAHKIKRLNISLYGLIAVLFLALVLLYNRHHALRTAEKAIQASNKQLQEANRIKEECIATFLCNESSVYSQLEKYQRYVKRRAQERKTEELLIVPQYIDVRTLRNDFYKRFDTMFLHIFPNFVEQFNALLREGEKQRPKYGELLNAELRIFALMRLGINDSNQIANLLDYSVNTIYTYKTRINNMTDLSPEEFRQRLMTIA